MYIALCANEHIIPNSEGFIYSIFNTDLVIDYCLTEKVFPLIYIYSRLNKVDEIVVFQLFTIIEIITFN